MNEALGASALVLFVLTALNVLAHRQAAAWAGRNIKTFGPTATTTAAATGFGLLTATLVQPVAGTGAAVASSSAAWLAVLATSTDLRSMKIPREPCLAVTAIGLGSLLASNPDSYALLSLGFGLVALVILTAFGFFYPSALGFGDVRMLASFTLCLSWWWTPTILFYAYLLACVLQVVLHLATTRTSFGQPGKPGGPVQGDSNGEPARPRSPAPESADRAPATSALVKVERKRRLLPFGPALAIAHLTLAIFAALTDVDPCQAWSVTGVC